MNYIKSFFFLILLIFNTIYFFSYIVLEKILYLLKRKQHTENESHHISGLFSKTLFSLIPGWDIQILNRNNLPKADKYPFIIVANHESATDILIIYYLDIQFRWLAKKELFKFPLIGQCMKWSGYIPIKRGHKRSHKEAMETCQETLVKKKTSVLFFPEGTRSTLGYPGKFKIGAFKLSQLTKTPILPVVIQGAKEQLSKGSLSPSRAKVNLSILPLTKMEKEESLESYTNRVQDIITKEHKKLSLIASQKM